MLAVEADRIQEFIFRSSRLRGVVGGSEMIAYFCRAVVPALIDARYAARVEILVADGGAFRLVGDEEALTGIGAEIAELYRRWTGGSITVGAAQPIAGPGAEEFRAAAHAASAELRAAKRAGESPGAAVQLPYTAICARCGVGLATAHRAEYGDERRQYVCEVCARKEAQGRQRGAFLEPFRAAVRAAYAQRHPDSPPPHLAAAAGGRWPEAVAALDRSGRSQVAYLIADGNGMGVLFDRCGSGETLKALSESLTDVIRESLAEPCADLLDELGGDSPGEVLPVLPLIMAGDEVFALVPASWALDIARRFCRAYERRMAQRVQDLGLGGEGASRPTVAAAIVSCKAGYPYSLAHEAGEQALGGVKRAILRETHRPGAQPFSAVDFLLISGRLPEDGAARQVRATLRPYAGGGGAPPSFGLPLERLLAQRRLLEGVPARRLQQLRELYAPENLPGERFGVAMDGWLEKQRDLLERVFGAAGDLLRAALAELGAPLEGAKLGGYWREVDRYPGDRFLGHGMPDLIEAWDCALTLTGAKGGEAAG